VKVTFNRQFFRTIEESIYIASVTGTREDIKECGFDIETGFKGDILDERIATINPTKEIYKCETEYDFEQKTITLKFPKVVIGWLEIEDVTITEIE
jgi:hypothetical protein